MANELVLHIDLANIPSETSKAEEALKKVTKGEEKQATTKSEQLLKAAKAVGAVQLTKQVLNVGKSVAMYRVSTISSRYGDAARQNELQNIMSAVDNASNFASTVVQSTVFGATAIPGGTGAIAGAIIGTISATISQLTQNFERRDQWQLQNNKNNINEVRQSERLGLLASDRNR